jgi:thiosulfate reductase cytochrome b subunit
MMPEGGPKETGDAVEASKAAQMEADAARAAATYAAEGAISQPEMPEQAMTETPPALEEVQEAVIERAGEPVEAESDPEPDAPKPHDKKSEAAERKGILSKTGRVEGATIRLEKKHPLAIRWMHWVNFPVLFTMIWSGLLIYWGDSDNAYQHPHRIYRIGIGSWTLFRFFPEWVYKLLNAPYQITTGLGWHFVFMWIFAINGFSYVTYLALSGNWRLMVPTMASWKEAILVTLYDLHLTKVHPPAKKYNGAQKIAYTAIVLMGLGSLLTGLAIYKPTQAHYLTSLLGGYEMARWEHFFLTIGFMAFFLLHVGQVVKTGWNNFRGMVSGYEIRPADSIPYTEEKR